MKKRISVIAFGIMAAFVAMPMPIAHGLQQTNGRIAYNRYDAATAISSIHTMDSSGANSKLVTQAASLNFDSLFPVWSPDGSSLAYTNFSYSSGAPDYGQSLRLAPPVQNATTRSVAANTRGLAVWSPDGVYVYYQAATSQVYRVRADGSQPAEKIVDPGYSITWFDVSADGSKLLYSSADSIYVYTPSSGTATKILGPVTGTVKEVFWSPDSTKITYSIVTSTVNITIYVANSDGTNSHAITSTSSFIAFATDNHNVWSPDSSKVLYRQSSNQAGACLSMGWAPSNLYVADAATGTATALTNTAAAQNNDASWSPDGQFVVYAGKPCAPGSSTHIYVMSPNGSNVTDLTPSETGDALYPAWEAVAAPSSITNSGTTTLVIAPGEDLLGRSVVVPDNTVLSNDGVAGDITVLSGGTLKGSGSTGDVTVSSGGVIAPGNSPGCLTTNDLILDSGSTYQYELGGTAPCTGHDQIQVTGTVTISGAQLSASFVNGFTGAPGSVYQIISNDGTDSVSGTFTGLAEGATLTIQGVTFRISYVGGTGNDVTLTQQNQSAATLAPTGSSIETILGGAIALIVLSLGVANTKKRTFYTLACRERSGR
jgi:Tol biopolymer transport system component